MLLIIGYKEESTIGHFVDYLIERNKKFDFLDLSLFKICEKVSIEESKSNLLLKVDDKVYSFLDYTVFYQRLFYTDLKDPFRNELFLQVINKICSYLEITNSVVLNRPTAGYFNSSKLLQLHFLKKAGFTIPDAHIAGDSATGLELLSRFPDLINKGCSGIRTIAKEMKEEQFTHLKSLKNCPSLFQQRIHGFDVRATLIGNKLIGLKIKSPDVDYRYPDESQSITYEEIKIPKKLKVKCRNYCRYENLVFAGIDFKVQDGKWYILEINPMPGYDFFDRKLNYKISAALRKFIFEETNLQLTYWLPHNSTFIGSKRRPVIKLR